MSVVAALIHQGRVYMAADSRGSAGCYGKQYREEKIFRRGPLTIGATGSWPLIQLLRHRLVLPEIHEDTYRYVVVDFYEALRDALREHGLLVRLSNGVEGHPGSILVGLHGRLFVSHSELYFIEPLDPFMAIGHGYQYALGALAVTEGAGLTPEERLQRVIEITARYDGAVAPPAVIVCGE
mgnify:CR=1 FL=1